MENIDITSLEQVPAGLTLLLKKIADIEHKISTPPQPTQQQSTTDALCTRKETARRLNITLATLNEYTKSGKIIAHRIGNRVLYKEADIQNALSQIITTKR
ncbi:helix-turn-helix domain-containing protein [Taibaiella soli]|uniref:DNA-binding protein n=1 Tax=Taibaiella soli TaxID=1649169 RepID=A0A2W2AQI6_9BACT|nr:DNA-binding protein [Taibaiella soli]